MIFMGYKLKGQDITTIEIRLREIKKAVNKRANSEYKKLLTQEIQTLVDHIALNEIQRPDNISLFDLAQNELNNKIAFASAKNLPIEYNLETSVHILFYKGDTYIKFNAGNNIYKKDLAGLHDIEEFPCEANGESEKVWSEIMKQYTDGFTPMGIRLFDGTQPIKPEHLKFESPAKRAKAIARHRLTNRYLSMYTGGQQIPNYKVMDYIDLALNALVEIPDSINEMRRMEAELCGILPEITTDLINKEPDNENNQKA